MADRLPIKAKYAPGSPTDVIALQEFEPTDTISLNLISGFSAGVTAELALNSISALADVDTSGSPSPANGEVLAWNSSTGMWEPTLSPGSSAAIWGNITGTLSDQTDLQNTLDGKANIVHTHVMADITDSTWISDITNEPIGDLSDVVLTTPANGELLQFDGTNWVNVPSNAVGVTDHTQLINIGINTHAQIDTHIADNAIHFTTLDGLSDVVYSGSPSPINGQVLTWNGNGFWEPASITSTDELVKVSANDTTAGYLSTELQAGSNITLTVLNPGADEKLEIKYDRTGMPYTATINGSTMVVFDDPVRTKTLSSEMHVLYFAETAIGNNDWISLGVTDADSGFICLYQATIVGIAAQCENTNGNTKDINLYINANNQGSVGQFTGAGEQSFLDTTLNIDVNQGDKIRLRGAPGQGVIQDTNIQIYLRYRV